MFGKKENKPKTKELAATKEITFRVTLPEAVYDDYELLAISKGETLDKVAGDRLAECRNHTATQGIYLDDTERKVLSQLFGIQNVNNSGHLLKLVTEIVELNIGDLDIKLPQEAIRRLQKHRKEPLAQIIQRVLTAALNAEAGVPF